VVGAFCCPHINAAQGSDVPASKPLVCMLTLLDGTVRLAFAANRFLD
jgi:hypothetical protein